MDKRAATGFGLRALIISMLLALVTACGGGGGGSAAVVRLQLGPASPTVAKGLTVDLTATAIRDNSRTDDVTSEATWTSLTPGVASVFKGKVTGLAVGTAEIRASFDGVQQSIQVSVTAASVVSLAITPVDGKAGLGATQKFTATARMTDGSTPDVSGLATWTATNDPAPTPPATAPAVLTIGSNGLATAKVIGKAKVNAVFAGVAAPEVGFEVTSAQFKEIQVEPAAPSIPKGLTQQLSATELLTDGTPTVVTNTATWTTSNAAIATVDSEGPARGLVTALEPGTATITATTAKGSRSVVVTVVNATLQEIQVETVPAGSEQLPKGGYDLKFIATGIFSDTTTRDLTSQALWTSSNEAAATVSNADATKGIATSAANSGTTNITAKVGTVTSDLFELEVTDDTVESIEVKPANSSLGLGQTQQFTATGIFSGDLPSQDITKRVTWSSADETIATISNAADSKGLAVTQSISDTPVAITAAFNGVEGSTNLTVTDAALLSIEISPDDSVLPKTFTRALKATGSYSDGSVKDVTAEVTWSSSSSSIATVSNATATKGVVRGGSAGTATITATRLLTNNVIVSDTTRVFVTDAVLESISVTPATLTLPLGLGQAFVATGSFSDDSTMDITEQVTWTSADPNVLSISTAAGTKGQAEAKALSTSVVVTAQKDTLSDTATVQVTNPAVESLIVRPDTETCASPVPAPGTEDSISLPLQFSTGLIACASYSDDVVRNVTSEVTWRSTDSSVVTVSNDAPTKGVITAVRNLVGAVAVSLGDKSDSIQVKVVNETLTGIAVTPADVVITNASAPVQFVATGSFTGDLTLNITRNVTWTVSSNTVTVSNEAGKNGQVSPARSPTFAQDVTITATRGAIKGEETFERRANPAAAE
jgi:uncharacterized protein YjdB